MTDLLAGSATALWLGILTSISPCPLASNVAAASFVGKDIGAPHRVFLAGLIYSAGRALTYVIVGALVVTSILSIPSVSFFLQQRMNQVLGPLLVIVGAAILGWIRIPLPNLVRGDFLQRRAAGTGLLGAGLLGILFALSFCPVSAGLFFGGLIPLATGAQSRILLPALYGLGTGLPVMAFALLIALGARGIGGAFKALARFERIASRLTGAVFILAGIYFILTHFFGVSL